MAKLVTSGYYFVVYLNMGSYKLDRTAFKAQTADEAVKRQAEYYRPLTWQERMHIANY